MTQPLPAPPTLYLVPLLPQRRRPSLSAHPLASRSPLPLPPPVWSASAPLLPDERRPLLSVRTSATLYCPCATMVIGHGAGKGQQRWGWGWAPQDFCLGWRPGAAVEGQHVWSGAAMGGRPGGLLSILCTPGASMGSHARGKASGRPEGGHRARHLGWRLHGWAAFHPAPTMHQPMFSTEHQHGTQGSRQRGGWGGVGGGCSGCTRSKV